MDSRKILEKYRAVIVRNLTPSDVLPQLMTLDAIQGVSGYILSKEKINKIEAATILVENLILSEEDGWYQLFLRSLKTKGYEILSRTLEGHSDVKNTVMLEKLLTLYYVKICEKVKASDLLDHLVSRGTLEREDVDRIKAEMGSMGDHMAVLTLLDLVVRKRESWFADLMIALTKCGYDYIVEEIDPDLVKLAKEGDDTGVEKLCDKLADDQCTGKAGDLSTRMDVGCSIHTEDTKVKSPYPRLNPPGDSVRHRHIEDMDADVEGKQLAASSKSFRTYQPPVSISEATTSSSDIHLTIHDYMPGEQREQQPMVADQGLSHPVQYNASNNSRESTYCTNIQSTSGGGVSGVLQSELHHSSHPDQRNQSLFAPNKRPSSEPLPDAGDCYTQGGKRPAPLGAESQPSAHTESSHTKPGSSEADINRGVLRPHQQEPADTNRGVESEPLVLRPYQQELAEEAVKGNNSIIVAPTGSGKTHVALYISQQHVKKSEAAEEAKIVFIVPTVALVSQQLAQYRKYLPELKCVGLQGDSEESLHLRLPIYDVFVLTPQILLNALQSRDVTTLAEFTLLIFDECHHTSKNHPYNGIMHCYFQEKKEGKAHLPQVVGLTASVGVGKTNNIDRAVDHILKMCANLDSRLKTVQCHKESLQKHVNTPDEDAFEVQSRKDHPFRTMIISFMTSIEEHMKRLPEIQQVKEVADFRSKLTAPSEKGSDPYTGWVSGLKRPVARIYDQKVRRIFAACLKHLKIYNDALFVNSDCRTVDAWNYIKKEVGEFSDAATYKDETDKWLENIFYNDKVQMQLGRICEDKANENPKLKKVKELLLESYRDKYLDLRGIVFCKTREMTQALKNWMNEDNELMVLNPERLVSSHSAQDRGGMTASSQIDVIQFFRDGKHKVIIATTIAEEGLDIRKCNLVLRYQHVTNETARIQAKGRGRDKDAKYMVVAERERIEKEETNRAREKLMHQAIAALLQKPEAEIEEQIRSIQVEEQLKQKHEELAKIAQQALRQKSRDIENEYEIRCFKCDELACLSSDIKHVENSLHMVVSSDFDTFIDKEPHPKPVRIQGGAQMQEKIYCKKCHTDWGITATYQGITYPIIKISAFIVVSPNECRDMYKKWVKVPFKVEQLTLEDREVMIDNLKK